MITFHEFYIFLSCITHAYKVKMCVFKWKRGKDIQKTYTAIWPYPSLIASEATSSLWFYLSCCLLEEGGFSFLFCGMLRAIQKCHLTKEKKKKSPLKFKLWHFFESCKEMMILYLKLSDASSKIPHCYVMYYHSNLSLHWYSTPYGQAVLCQRCCFSDDAKNTEHLNSKSLKQCFPSDHTESQKEWIPKLWQGKGGTVRGACSTWCRRKINVMENNKQSRRTTSNAWFP